MSKKSSGLFNGTKGNLSKKKGTTNEMNFNSAGSKDVKIVKQINSIENNNHISAPIKSVPNSVTKIIYNGKLIRERYYDENGYVYLDIDYSNHGNSKTHPVVPHQHKWVKEKSGKISRNEWEKINNE